MSVEQFLFLLSDTTLSQNDKKWFPKWIRRYGSCNPLVNGRLPIFETLSSNSRSNSKPAECLRVYADSLIRRVPRVKIRGYQLTSLCDLAACRLPHLNSVLFCELRGFNGLYRHRVVRQTLAWVSGKTWDGDRAGLFALRTRGRREGDLRTADATQPI